jgi:hypothetical protein
MGNIRTDVRDIGWEHVDWMYLAMVRDQWRGFVNPVMNVRVLLKDGNFLTS